MKVLSARWHGCLAWGIFILAAFAWIRMIQDDRPLANRPVDGQQRAAWEEFYNGDTLSPASLYQDLFVDGYSIRGWQFAAANYAFPDIPVYFLIRAITGSHSLAIPLYAIVQMVLTALLMHQIIRNLTPEKSPSLSWFLCGTSCVLSVCTLTKCEDLILVYLLRIQFHFGVILSGLLLSICILRYQKSHSDRSGWLFLSCLSWLSFGISFSDRLVFIQYFAPLILYVVLWQRFMLFNRRTIKLLMLIGIGCILGILLSKYLIRKDAIESFFDLNAEKRFHTFKMMYEGIVQQIQQGDPSHWLLLIWCCAQVLRFLFDPTRCRALDRIFYFWVCLVFTNGFAVWYTGSLTQNGEFVWEDGLRYFIPVFAIPWLFLPVLVYEYFGDSLRTILYFCCCLLFSSLACLQSSNSQISILKLYPRWVQQIDDWAEARQLRYGLAGFWEARIVTLFSQKGLRVYPILPVLEEGQLSAYHWLGNIDWYTEPTTLTAEKPHYQFLFEHGVGFHPNFMEWDAILPKNLQREKVGNFMMRTDMQQTPNFAHYFSWQLHHLKKRFHFFRSTIQSYPAAAQFTQLPTATINADGSRSATEGVASKGFLSFGPYLSAPTGKLEIQIDISGNYPADSCYWDIQIVHPTTKETSTLFQGKLLPHTTDYATNILIPKSQKRWQLEVRVYYGGQGTLTHHQTQIRLPD